MRFYDKKKVAMLDGVSYFLGKNKDKLAEKAPAFKDLIDEFIKKHKALKELDSATSQQKVKAETGGKSIAKREFVREMAKLIALLTTVKYKVNKKPLPEMGYSKNKLEKMAADKLLQTFDKLFKAARKVKNPRYYGVTEENMRDMAAYYKEFKDKKSAPKKKKKQMKDNRSEIQKKLKDCQVFLKDNIDPMMVIVAEHNQRLYDEYKAGRKVFPRKFGRPSEADIGYRKSRKQKVRMSPPGPEGPVLDS